MGIIGMAPYGGVAKQECRRTFSETHLLGNLVIGSLIEGAVRGKDGLSAGFGHCGSHGNGVLFGNTDIDVLFSRLFSIFFMETDTKRCGGSHDHHARVLFHLGQKMLGNQCAIVFLRHRG